MKDDLEFLQRKPYFLYLSCFSELYILGFSGVLGGGRVWMRL